MSQLHTQQEMHEFLCSVPPENHGETASFTSISKKHLIRNVEFPLEFPNREIAGKRTHSFPRSFPMEIPNLKFRKSRGNWTNILNTKGKSYKHFRTL